MKKVILLVIALSVSSLCACAKQPVQKDRESYENGQTVVKDDSNEGDESLTEELMKGGDEQSADSENAGNYSTDGDSIDNKNTEVDSNVSISDVIQNTDVGTTECVKQEQTQKADDSANTGSTVNNQQNNDILDTSAEQSEALQEVTPEPEVYVPVSYSPEHIVALAIEKCEAGGMITTEHNLANLLAEGKITQEEYEEYYPLDGMENSYYSVFVNTDLNKAATISGELLYSEDGIADYIAEMLLLETRPIFNVTYAGIYASGNGTQFYEFRCHR